MAGGVVSYSNEAKIALLGVDPALIERHGAVSPEVAAAMAQGALRRFEADTAVAITGIAGPGGGTEEKPVGTVCFCVSTADGRVARARHPAARRARRRPRALDHGGHAPAAAAAQGRGRGAPLSGPRARMFVALDLPEAARGGAAAWCAGACWLAGATCGRCPRTTST